MINQATSFSGKNTQPILHRAPWVVSGLLSEIHPDVAGVYADGGVLVSEGTIQAVGRFCDLNSEYGGISVKEHEDRILVPALVNSHCHLELSSFALAATDTEQNVYDGNITQWIRDLIEARASIHSDDGDAEEKIINTAVRVLDRMAAEGVGFVGDIGNSLSSSQIGQQQQNTKVCFLLELLGLAKVSETKSLERLAAVTSGNTPGISCTAHAPYSATPLLMQKIKKMSNRQGRVFSIHVAESVHEIEFLRSGTGEFKEFLIEQKRDLEETRKHLKNHSAQIQENEALGLKRALAEVKLEIQEIMALIGE